MVIVIKKLKELNGGEIVEALSDLISNKLSAFENGLEEKFSSFKREIGVQFEHLADKLQGVHEASKLRDETMQSELKEEIRIVGNKVEILHNVYGDLHVRVERLENK